MWNSLLRKLVFISKHLARDYKERGVINHIDIKRKINKIPK